MPEIILVFKVPCDGDTTGEALPGHRKLIFKVIILL